ncbi:MAG: succinylglutamate desuccinylase/aspartoacylase family protein [Planctomycetaceae bacterium]
MPLQLGTAKAQPGKLTYGTWDLVEHPTGGKDQLPVVLAQGSAKGPVFWLTAGIHGNEHAGLQALHLLVTRSLVNKLRGTIVCLPALNPAGLRTMRREAYYHPGDPNRLFPDQRPRDLQDPDSDPPSVLELAYSRLFAEMRQTANYWIDLHNTWTGSISMVYRDRVYYRDDGTPAAVKQAKAQAEELDRKLGEMCAAYGHSVLNEMGCAAYFQDNLHRSTTGAAVNVARIPAMTMELGTGHMPDPHIVAACVTGLTNVLSGPGCSRAGQSPSPGSRWSSRAIPAADGAPRGSAFPAWSGTWSSRVTWSGRETRSPRSATSGAGRLPSGFSAPKPTVGSWAARTGSCTTLAPR